MQRVDLLTFCADSILMKVDKASMAHSLEVHVPFLDHRIIEWGLTQPVAPAEKTQGKQVLRHYLAADVPASILNHPKQGFSLNLNAFNWNEAVNFIREGYFVRSGALADDCLSW